MVGSEIVVKLFQDVKPYIKCGKVLEITVLNVVATITSIKAYKQSVKTRYRVISMYDAAEHAYVICIHYRYTTNNTWDIGAYRIPIRHRDVTQH